MKTIVLHLSDNLFNEINTRLAIGMMCEAPRSISKAVIVRIIDAIHNNSSELILGMSGEKVEVPVETEGS